MSITKTVLCSDDPPRHIMIGYDSYEDFYDLSCKFINEGLKRNQFCVYAALKDIDNEKKKLSERITDFDENIGNGNLLIIDLKEFYISVLENNFESFNNLLEMMNEKIKDRSDKRVRLCGFLTGFFYEKKHFDECIALEEWWENNNFKGTVLCPFTKSSLEHDTFDNSLEKVMALHSNVIIL